MPLDPTLQRAIEARLEFYREIGVYDFYRRAQEASVDAEAKAETVANYVEPPPLVSVPVPPLPDLLSNLSIDPAETVRAPSVMTT